MTEHIDLMIKAEEMEKRQGFMQRINTLRESRRRAELTKYADEFRKDAHTTLSAAGGTRTKQDSISLVKRIKQFFY